MNDKKSICSEGAYFTKKIGLNETVRLAENMSSINEIIFYSINSVIMESCIHAYNLHIKGKCVVDIVYMGENSCVDGLSIDIPFEFTEPTEYETGLFFGDCVSDAAELTPIKARRCDINANVQIKGYIYSGIEPVTDFSPDEPITIYRNEKRKTVSALNTASKTDIYEYTHLSGFSDDIKVVYAIADVLDLQTNHSTAGILINGTLRQNILYSKINDDDTVTYHTIEENTVFNQFCELSYGTEFTDYDVKCSIFSVETHLTYSDGECMIGTKVHVKSDILFINTFEISVTEDLFSPEYDIKCDMNNIKGIKLTKILTEDISLNFNDYNNKHQPVKIAAGRETFQIDSVDSEKGLLVNISAASRCITIDDAGSEPKEIYSSISENINIYCEKNIDAVYFATYSLTDTTRQLNQGSVSSHCRLKITVFEAIPVNIPEISSYTLNEYYGQNPAYITVKIHYPESYHNIFELSKESRQNPDRIKTLIETNGEDVPVIVWDQIS